MAGRIGPSGFIISSRSFTFPVCAASYFVKPSRLFINSTSGAPLDLGIPAIPFCTDTLLVLTNLLSISILSGLFAFINTRTTSSVFFTVGILATANIVFRGIASILCPICLYCFNRFWNLSNSAVENFGLPYIFVIFPRAEILSEIFVELSKS